MPTRDVDCRCDEVNLRGYLALDEEAAELMCTALYSDQADRRSRASMLSLFDEVLT